MTKSTMTTAFKSLDELRQDAAVLRLQRTNLYVVDILDKLKDRLADDPDASSIRIACSFNQSYVDEILGMLRRSGYSVERIGSGEVFSLKFFV
jgi:hypothetical protein